MKVTRIDHVGILVADLEAALRFYTVTCGLTAGPIETREQPPIRRCCLRVGETELELIEARDAEQTMIRLLPHHGPGIYHLGLRVEDVDAAAAELDARGVPLVDTVREGDDMRIQYLHPDAAQGTMIELVTRKR
ncbi:MAG TPA: VOC family protein [Candidatus Dormibacteraeota bacterium]|nr:VOC family protein [Candidatus Dormibacteraeota bacterium]